MQLPPLSFTKKLLLSLLWVWGSFLVGFGQGEGANWFFGINAGVRFGNDTVVGLSGGKLDTGEACATLSDPDGNLLFYTNGVTVWNRNHQTMLNGTGLMGYLSSSQCLIAPHPGNDSLYYIFTTRSEESTSLPNFAGFNYAIVNMRGGNGLGEVVSKINPLFGNSTEKVAMTRADNGIDLWVLAHERGNNRFRAYRLTCEGLDTNYVASEVGTSHPHNLGYMKFSADGTRLATAIGFSGFAEVFDFDPSTGLVTNPISLPGQFGWYGAEFSPNGRFLYLSQVNFGDGVYQFDLSAGNATMINNSRVEITGDTVTPRGTVQMGIDGRLYVSTVASKYLSIIPYPDSIFPGCGFIEDGVRFSRLSDTTGSWGLPHIYPSRPISQLTFSPIKVLCSGDSADLKATHSYTYDSLRWEIIDQVSGTRMVFPTDSVSLGFPDPGEFTGQLIVFGKCQPDTLDFQIKVLGPPRPEFDQDTLMLCAGTEILLLPNGIHPTDSLSWSTGESSPVITVTEPGEYEIETFNDCGTGSASVLVILEDAEGVFIPNVFTPNGDGINDFFKIETANEQDFHLWVFDRWGQKVFESTDPNRDWEGRTGSTLPKAGLYYYLLKARDCQGELKDWQGGVSVIR